MLWDMPITVSAAAEGQKTYFITEKIIIIDKDRRNVFIFILKVYIKALRTRISRMRNKVKPNYFLFELFV